MHQYFTLIYFMFLILGQSVIAQRKTYQISTVAFYNLENLFDTLDDPNIFDDEYTPNGRKCWNSEKLRYKLDNLSTVISKIGAQKTYKPPAILGVSEVENLAIIQQLANHPNLANANYEVIHFNSPDRRGIDVAFLYDRNRFTVIEAQKHELLLKDVLNKRVYTRDQLCVFGLLGKEPLYCIVNHWPSRRGGTKKSNYKRMEASNLTKKVIDSIYTITKEPNIIVMGDFNDGPFNKSLKNLGTQGKIKEYNSRYFFNPMEQKKKKGEGTLAYRDQWNVFDQLIFSNTMLDSIGVQLYQTHIYNPKYLMESKGKYKGYPKRSTTKSVGYSDHFPVYSYLINECVSDD